jgi:acyl-CoA thioesterase FadM
MESAETDFLHARGLSVTWTEDGRRYGFPRVSVGCDFKRPVRFEDILEIAVVLEEVGRKSVRYRFDFRRGPDEVAVGRITAVFCRTAPDHGIESIEIPPGLRAKLTGGVTVR